MASSLVRNPVLNKEFSEWISTTFSKIKDTGKNISEISQQPSAFSWIAFVGILGLVIALVIYYFKASAYFETPANISRLGRTALKAQSIYDSTNKRGIRSFLSDLKQQGIPDNQFCLTNFYFCTVNAAAVFLPPIDSIVTPNAIKVAFDAGARAFVFDLWPDMTPGSNFAPVIQIVESGSLWRRISMNALPFASCLQALVQSSVQLTTSPGGEDPLIIYLRFRGNPRTSTFTATAQALQAVIEPYRLDPIFNNCRGQDDLFKVLMTNLFRKVIVVSNKRASGNMLSDYINIGPREGIKLEWGINEARGLGVDAKAQAIRKIQQNLSFVAPLSEVDDATKNYDSSPARDIGIHCCAMNLWNHNDSLKNYLNNFKTAGYALKPEPLRYIIETLPPPKYPQNPNWGSGTTAGTPTTPPALRLP